jgi:RNA 2',3'-cyclic 3'-phosphodiesterase
MRPQPSRVRAFVALRLDGAVEDAIEQFVAPLRPLGNGVRWVPRSNFHLTLRFLGNEAPSALIEALVPELAAIARRTQPFVLSVESIGGFPQLARPRVIWIGLHGDGLLELAASVRTAAAHVGFEGDEHPYTPHLTIARVHEPNRLGELPGALQSARAHHFGTSTIASMALYRSVLTATGPIYTELERWYFGAG